MTTVRVIDTGNGRWMTTVGQDSVSAHYHSDERPSVAFVDWNEEDYDTDGVPMRTAADLTLEEVVAWVQGNNDAVAMDAIFKAVFFA